MIVTYQNFLTILACPKYAKISLLTPSTEQDIRIDCYIAYYSEHNAPD